MDTAIIRAFHATSRLQRTDIFSGNTLTPVTAVEDAHTPAPGWVGDHWHKGTVLIGINPGGGGDNYRRNPTDDQLYKLLRKFRDTEESNRASAFSEVSSFWAFIQRTHNVWRVINAVLEATGESESEIAFMNVMPFRTRMDKLPSRVEIAAAWKFAAKPQLDALMPSRIVCLGKIAWDVLRRFDVVQHKIVLMKRAIGDSYIPPEAQETLRQLAKQRQHG
jgi:hypothetical protein